VASVVRRDRWAQRFEREAAALAHALGEGVVAIEHVGATSVPGLAARPILDVLVGLPGPGPTPAQLAALERLDYRPPRRRAGRAYVCKGRPREVTVHFAQWGSPRWWRLVDFRDALRGEADARRRYEELKASLSRAGQARYAEGKRRFVESELQRIAVGRR
jgi:GrpB-like predicted nucleotidyltransferase (UPF0157 family)